MMWNLSKARNILALFLVSCLSVIAITHAIPVRSEGIPMCKINTPLGDIALPDVTKLNPAEFKQVAKSLVNNPSSPDSSVSINFDSNQNATLSFPKLNLNAEIDRVRNFIENDLSEFKEFQALAIDPISSVSSISLGSSPQEIIKNLLNMFAKADIVLGEKEKKIEKKVVSGKADGDQLTIVPCKDGNCPHIELTNWFKFQKNLDVGVNCAGLNLASPIKDWSGERWVGLIGKHQMVEGGTGKKCFLPFDKEPAGRPFIGDFKMVLVGFNEQKGTAKVTLYMRIRCGKGGATPYFFPTLIEFPIPIKEKGIVFMGLGKS